MKVTVDAVKKNRREGLRLGLSSHCVRGESCILLQTTAAKETMPMPLGENHSDNSVC